MSDPETLVRRIFDAFNQRTFAGVAAEVIGPDFVRHDLMDLLPGVRGQTGAADWLTMLTSALPDSHLEIEDIFESNGMVTVRYHLSGTHTGGPLFGLSETGKPLDLRGINIYRVTEGKIVETWQTVDGLAIWRAAGRVSDHSLSS